MNVVALGGGTNSAAMLIGAYRRDIQVDRIVFSDTGAERPETYEFIDIFGEWLRKHGMPKVEIVRYQTKDGKLITLEEECLKNRCLPGIAYGGIKSCSEKYKIRPQTRFFNTDPLCEETWKKGEKVVKYIGFDSGEPQRAAHAEIKYEKNPDPKYINKYPLIEFGWDRQKCKDVIASEDLKQPGKSSCFFCPNMKKHEIEELSKKHPDLFKRACEMEHNAKLTSVKGLGRDWAWTDYIAALRDAVSMFDLFPEVMGMCGCSMPCGCYDG